MPLTVVTWNINSVRLRFPLIERLIAETAPDVLCLQETKCGDEKFPVAGFQRLGYRYQALHGYKGHHGVAILSRRPLNEAPRQLFTPEDGPRHVAAQVEGGPVIHNFYVPAGGDIPDPDENPKFAHKIKYLKGMAKWLKANPPANTLLVGDLNIAPLEHDVWSHKQLLGVVSHTPVEVKHLAKVQKAGGFIDPVRQHRPEPEKLYTWWSYRAADWGESNRGRRLDHVWATPDLADQVRETTILSPARGWDRPSDHVPIVATLR